MSLYTLQDTDGTSNRITFTTGNTSNSNKHLGTSYSTYKNVYNGCGFETNTNYFNVINGIQLWKAPLTGTYEIEVAGGGGGSCLTTTTRLGGAGAIIKGTKTLSSGDILRIIVGSRGGRFGYTSGGGGASVVGPGISMTNAGTTTNSLPWIIAGGGGGGGNSGGNGKNAEYGESSSSGNSTSTTYIGTANTNAGSGGRTGQTANGGWGGGGAGWLSNGGGNSNTGSCNYQTHYNSIKLNSSSAPNGSYNSTSCYSNPFQDSNQGSCRGAAGGFGGGGNGACNGGGAGAGYTGGNSSGAGGGSYFNTSEMTNRYNVGTQSRDNDGYVKITITSSGNSGGGITNNSTILTNNIKLSILKDKYINSGITNASGHSKLSSSLYSFSAHTFTNCGATGNTGPSLSDCIISYGGSSTNNWWNNTSYFNVIGESGVNGIQVWKVPDTGTYQIYAKGASEGYSQYGQGACIYATFTLTKGDTYMILVGQMGTQGNGSGGWVASGGGGGTFMVKGSNYSDRTINDVLVIAGGGGGSIVGTTGTLVSSGGDGLSSSSSTTTGGTNSGSNNGGGGGGGLIGNGTGWSSSGGISFINGGKGGTGHSTQGISHGGFGGGGGGGGNPGGGGGGIYGGNWGESGITNSGSGYNRGGQGGGSHVNSSGTNVSYGTSNNNTHGSLTITPLSLSNNDIKLNDFRGASFVSGDPVPSTGPISINSNFKGKTFGTSIPSVTEYEFNATHIPNQSGTYSGSVRGLWFRNTTGSDMTITEIRVAPNNSGNQSIWVGDLGTSPPPSYSSTTTASTAYLVKNNSDTWWTVPNSGITIANNNYVGILGKRSTNSYGAYGGSTITFPSNHNITIYRFIHQGHIYNTSYSATSLPVSNNNSSNTTSSISRIFFKYTL